MTAFVNSHYPQAEYIHIYTGKEETKVKILDGELTHTLLFDYSGNWLSTQTKLHTQELPENILSAFCASEYAAFKIDDAVEYQTADDEHYFLLTIKDYEGDKQDICIHADGSMDGEGGEAEDKRIHILTERAVNDFRIR